MINGFLDIEFHKPPANSHILVLYWRDTCGEEIQYLSIAKNDDRGSIYVAHDDFDYFAHRNKECPFSGTKDSEGRDHNCLGEPWIDDIHITHWAPMDFWI